LSGTPVDLYQELNFLVGAMSCYSTEWRQNSIALSKRLLSLKAGQWEQGIKVKLSRAKEIKITIIRKEEFSHD
jgi:hypothetical protein